MTRNIPSSVRGPYAGRRFGLFLISLGCLFYAPVPIEAAAVTFFNNLGSGGTYSLNQYWCLTGTGGGCGQPDLRKAAASFSPTANYVLTQVDLALQLVAGTNQVLVSVQSDNGGAPSGTILASSVLSGLTAYTGANCCPLNTATFASGPTLTAGTVYWLVVTPIASDTGAVWMASTTGGANPLYFFSGQWHTTSGPEVAFDLLGTPVPIYSNLDTGGTYDPASGWCVTGTSGGCGPSDLRKVAASFTPSGNSILKQVNIPLQSYTGTNQALVSVQSDSGGVPSGTALASSVISGVPTYTGTNCCPLKTIVFASGPLLTAGTKYWLVAAPVASDTGASWLASTIGGPNPLSFFSGAWHTTTGPAVAFDVYGGASAPGFDFNADGKSDILWQHPTTGDLWVWFMNGASYAGAASINGPTVWRVPGAADFNGDGKPDILWQNPSTGELWVWFMNGASWAGQAQVGGSTPWRVVGTGDFNGDGKPDILWQLPSTGELWVWYMNGATRAGQAQIGGATTWSVVGAADLNGDGNFDLLWQHPVTGELWVWYMNGASWAGQYRISSATPWKVFGTGDFNGDGKPDLLWQLPATGELWTWFMNGSAYAGAAQLGGATPWKAIGAR